MIPKKVSSFPQREFYMPFINKQSSKCLTSDFAVNIKYETNLYKIILRCKLTYQKITMQKNWQISNNNLYKIIIIIIKSDIFVGYLQNRRNNLEFVASEVTL